MYTAYYGENAAVAGAFHGKQYSQWDILPAIISISVAHTVSNTWTSAISLIIRISDKGDVVHTA